MMRQAITMAFFFATTAPSLVAVAEDSPGLEYRTPASEWMEALPLGNGRLGAMPFGGVEKERILLNEDTIVTGGPVERGDEPITEEAISMCRELLIAGNTKEDVDLMREILDVGDVEPKDLDALIEEQYDEYLKTL